MHVQILIAVVLAVAAGIGCLMLNEVTVGASLAGAKNGASVNASGTVLVSMAGNTLFENTQSIPFAVGTTAVSLGGIGTAGYVYLKNLDATNYIDIGLTSGTPVTNKFIRLLPGQVALLPTPSAGYFAQANTAACLLQVSASEL